jgi:hypothetical protein
MPNDGEPNVDLFNDRLQNLKENGKGTWFTAPWLYAEYNYFYPPQKLRSTNSKMLLVRLPLSPIAHLNSEIGTDTGSFAPFSLRQGTGKTTILSFPKKRRPSNNREIRFFVRPT